MHCLRVSPTGFGDGVAHRQVFNAFGEYYLGAQKEYMIFLCADNPTSSV